MSRFACGTTFIVSTFILAAGSQASGPGFSGLFATADSAETVAANPAGMVMLEGTQITLQGALIQDFSTFEVDENVTTVEGGNPQDATPVLAPSLYYSYQYDEDWFVGFSLNVPLGFGSNNGRKWAGRYYSDEFSLVYVSLNL
ncbi:Uncharacterised protein [Halioglobus japonicus]|nr:Uncharacterised protein [Halioglobus japonicus]